MAQRTHTCPNCSQPFNVPDNYFRASIKCPGCHALLDRRTGALVQPAGAAGVPVPGRPAVAPQTRPTPALPAHPYPSPQAAQHQAAAAVPYPAAQALAYQQPVKRGLPGWAIGVIVGGVLFVGVAIAVVVWAVGSISDASSVPDKAEWVSYTAPDKQFTALFPREPSLASERAPNGVQVNSAAATWRGGHFEVAWLGLSREHQFDAADGLRAFAQEVGGTLTKHHVRDFCGFPGTYGEIDNGECRVLIFRTRQRVWVIAATSEFEFFVDNLKLSEEALGLQPLRVEFTAAKLYQDVDVAGRMVGFAAFGGRGRHRFEIKGSLPAGLRRQDATPDKYLLAGAPTKEGKYRATVTVFDVDDRKASVEVDFVVEAVPNPVALIPSTQTPQRGDTVMKTSPWNYSAEVGLPLQLTLVVESYLAGYVVEVDQLFHSAERTPEWMTVEGAANRIRLSGTPNCVGVQELGLKASFKLPGTSLSHTQQLDLKFTIEPVPEALRKGLLPAPKPALLKTVVGVERKGEVPYAPTRPSNWGWQRDWYLSGEWDISEAKLPKGLTLTVLEQLAGELPTLYFEGPPEESGKWEFDAKLTAHVDYVEESFEVILHVIIEVGPIATKELPAGLVEDPPEWVIDVGVNRAVGEYCPLVLQQPYQWNREREWKIDVVWHIDELTLPKGLKFNPKTVTIGEFSVPRLYLTGKPTEVGEWNLDVKVTVTLKYVSDPYEITVPLKITVK